MKLPIEFFASLPFPPSTPTAPPTNCWTAPLSPARLIGHALDAGYGAPADLLGPGHTAMPLELQQFMTLRMRSAWKLLKKRAAGYAAHAFVSALDATDKGDASTILGSICARAAIERWLQSQTPKQEILRFWHYSVYTSKSVGRQAIALTWGGGKSAPDFLVCAKATTGLQHWYALEAKGTLGPRDWSAIQEGLNQAQLVCAIQVFPEGDTHIPTKAFCSQAHLHGTPPTLLRATLVDPPPADDALSLQLCEPIGVLRQLARGVAQWAVVTDNATVTEDGRHHWARLARGVGLGAPLELGVLSTVYEASDAIGVVLRAFDWLADALLDPFLARSAQNSNRLDWSAALAGAVAQAPFTTSQLDANARRLATDLLDALRIPQMAAPIDWGEAMSQLMNARVRISLTDTEPSSVVEFANSLDQQSEPSRVLRAVTERLTDRSSDSEVQVLLNGLAIRQRPESLLLETIGWPAVPG